MKVYFAGSIRGGRCDADLYHRMIERINEKHAVLTEHVGSLDISEQNIEKKDDRKIYETDMAWLRQSDIVIAECTTPSLGVGYELCYAEKCGIPVYIFYNDIRCRSLSAMLTGNEYFHIIPYEDEDGLFEKLDSII